MEKSCLYFPYLKLIVCIYDRNAEMGIKNNNIPLHGIGWCLFLRRNRKSNGKVFVPPVYPFFSAIFL